MDEKTSKLFLALLDKLYNTEPAGEPFRKPVDVVKYGCFDYYLYVKHPIDLSTIRQRLITDQYKDAWRFVADVQLMFANAYLFNKKGTPVYEFTNKLNKIWTTELTPIMQRSNYCCGTLHKFGPQPLFCHGTTPDRYCQIAIGAKYKCYQDQYSFCMPCFNKIDTEFINIQNLSCETARMKLPTQPVKKCDFIDCANDNWQYESFIQCIQCSRRVHQICELYPADEDELKGCIQHAQLEQEQKMLCQVPEEYRTNSEDKQEDISKEARNDLVNETENQPQPEPNQQEIKQSEIEVKQEQNDHNEVLNSAALDDELLQFARDVEDSHSINSAPASPNPIEVKSRNCSAKEVSHKKQPYVSHSERSVFNTRNFNSNHQNAAFNPEAKNSVDDIAARLSINKLSVENQNESILNNKPINVENPRRDKFVCNHCYRKKKIEFNFRHRKYSARRLPHTRMSKYIETKVNEHIRVNSPTAGEVTIRVLTAYRDTISVKSEMSEYLRTCREKDSSQHPNLKDYPDKFGYTNRAIFAWQEIDGVDVCVFGMHVQEYGEDCPEPNRQVIYLSYLDSVHFFRPKQVRTAVYHEILLSYFRYVKKLGFRRVFIWVCPSRKGDDYIFYRHPTEQKMPTLKRLSDWYVNLLDKGIMAGIVERHQNIHQYAASQNWNSVLSMPYLSGDYWPGEFERLLKIMIESQKEHEVKLMQLDRKDDNPLRSTDLMENGQCGRYGNNLSPSRVNERHNMTSLTSLYNRQPPSAPSHTGKIINLKSSVINSLGLKPSILNATGFHYPADGDYVSVASMTDESKYYSAFTPESRSDSEQPLDLSKSSSTTSPETLFDDDFGSELSYSTSGSNNKKKRRKSSSAGYTKKRNRTSSQSAKSSNRLNQTFGGPWDNNLNKFNSQPTKSCRLRSSTQSNLLGMDTLLSPEEELEKNLERSLKRQREGFIVARLNDCDCSPHFESQRRKEEVTFTCELMKGREPFLQLARLKNYEFSTLRRAKFSSLAMVKHLGQFFKLDPICNECFSFDSSKRHYACANCEDFYLCTSCHENTPHDHIMSLMAPSSAPDIDEFLQQCSLASTTNSISSASSTVSNKSFNESNLDVSSQLSVTPIPRKDASLVANTPLNRHLSNGLTGSVMPLSCQKQKNIQDIGHISRLGDEENAKNICSLGDQIKLCLPEEQLSPPPSHSANNIRNSSNIQVELDQVMIENFIRHAEVSYSVDFDEMKNESKKLLTHYWSCPIKDTCHRCKFVVLSCSFMSVLMRSSRMQMMINSDPSEFISNMSIMSNNSSGSGAANLSNNTSNPNLTGGINLTTAHRYSSYQPKDK